MAIVADDDFRFGLRGRVGDSVFRRVYGKTIESRRPRKLDQAKQSGAQRETRSTFRAASAWAKRTLQDPQKKAYYMKRAEESSLTNAYIAAIRDYMRNPALAEETYTSRPRPCWCPHQHEAMNDKHEPRMAIYLNERCSTTIRLPNPVPDVQHVRWWEHQHMRIHEYGSLHQMGR